MKIDCFVSTLDNTPNRVEWSRQTLGVYLSEPSLRVTVLDAGSDASQLEWFKSKGLVVIPQPKEGSLYRRFLLAEAYAESPYYLLSDNDIVPLTEHWLAKGLEIARRYATFGYLVYRLSHSDFPFNHEFQNSEIRSIAKGGGLAIIQKDCRTVPFKIPYVYDPSHMDDFHYCDAIRKSKYGVGMFEQLYVEHLGRAESTK